MPSTGFIVAPSKDPSITSGLTQKAAEYEGASLLVGASLSLDPSGDDISLLGDEASLKGGGVYSPGGVSLGDSTATGHTSTSKVKQAT